MEVLRTEELTREYGFGDNKVVALNHVSFSVEEGEFVTILGPSGSGKSTLLHLLGGGGNGAAAGAQLSNSTVEAAYTRLMVAIDNYFSDQPETI